MQLIMKRAAAIAALSFLALPAFAQTKNGKSETYKDIIEKAYNLSLQRDRQQALNILATAIQRETRPQAISELKKTTSEVANVFFSDKAQQLFENGVSLRKTDLNQALDKVTEAARIEPDNFSIINEQARLLIAKGDCKNAQENVQKQLKVVSFDEELKLSLAQALICQNRWLDYQKVADTVVIKRSPQQKFWQALEVEKSLGQKSLTKAQDALANLKKSDEKYPELYYWNWKYGQTLKKNNPDEAQKYVMSCKNISANQYRQYMIDPMLCRRLVEVEGELKGMNGTPE
ncbi:tetratricopeptide repeat protein [Bdellovibrio bacteriovorus]|uniref:tetratricopeptide repeat protein n=1 Tax=Bdellovibrio bacteriovorus TaxID=959 RepID=UPI0035A6F106